MEQCEEKIGCWIGGAHNIMTFGRSRKVPRPEADAYQSGIPAPEPPRAPVLDSEQQPRGVCRMDNSMGNTPLRRDMQIRRRAYCGNISVTRDNKDAHMCLTL